MDTKSTRHPVSSGAAGNEQADETYRPAYDRPLIVIWPRTSRLTTCGTCREQLDANSYLARMRLFEQAAEEFSLRELGRPYCPFEGRSA